MKTLQLIIAEGKHSSLLHNKENQCSLVFNCEKHSNLLWQKHLLITQNKNALLNIEKHSRLLLNKKKRTSLLFNEVKDSDLLLKSVHDTKIYNIVLCKKSLLKQRMNFFIKTKS
jgi:hypothetical protein